MYRDAMESNGELNSKKKELAVKILQLKERKIEDEKYTWHLEEQIKAQKDECNEDEQK